VGEVEDPDVLEYLGHFESCIGGGFRLFMLRSGGGGVLEGMPSLLAVLGGCDPMVAGNKGFGRVVTVVVMFVFRVGGSS
jgi:hypothetical protein